MGGTKVLMALFKDDGTLMSSHKFPTSHDYSQFLTDFRQEFTSLRAYDLRGAGIAVPAMLDRPNGRAVHFGNLPWENVPLLRDFQAIVSCPVVLENDAKAGAVYQAHNVSNEFKKMLYIAVGTGVGVAYTSNGVLDTAFGDDGGRSIMITQEDGTTISWDHLASGKAIYERFGQKASEITDPESWKVIAHNLALGILQLLPIFDTEVIVFGGGVGAHLEHFEKFLSAEIAQSRPTMPLPAIRMGIKPEEAVVYGCFELAKQAT